MKFKSKTEESAAATVLKEGKKTQFWTLIMKSIDESIEHIQKQMEREEMNDLPAEQYKFMNECFKAKKQFLETLKRTPDNIASWLETPPSERPKEFDPYD